MLKPSSFPHINYTLGDLTEDPDHPKIIWPSVENCPECRSQQQQFRSSPSEDPGIPVLGEVWDVSKTAAYLTKVYRKENVVPNNVKMTDRVRGGGK